jgi:flagellar motor protein MotB
MIADAPERNLSARLKRPARNMKAMLSYSNDERDCESLNGPSHKAKKSFSWLALSPKQEWLGYTDLVFLMLASASLVTVLNWNAQQALGSASVASDKLEVFSDQPLDLTILDDGFDKVPATAAWLKDIELVLASKKAQHFMIVSEDEQATLLHIDSRVLFNAGATDIARSGEALLDSLLPILKRAGHTMVIEAHTNDRPSLFGAIRSAQSLSLRRATAVLQHFIAEGFSEDLLSAKGFGDSQPLQANDTERRREQNRRITLRIEK